MRDSTLRLLNVLLFVSATVLAASPYAAFSMLPAGAMGYLTRIMEERIRARLDKEG